MLKVWRQAGRGAVGPRRQWFHASVRGSDHCHGPHYASEDSGQDGWRARHTPIVHHYVETARDAADHSEVTRVAFDETSARRGHDYVTLFADLDKRRVLFATDGKDSATVAAFAADLTAHGGDPQAVAEVCIDMSQAFIKGVTEHLPQAGITFDKFHAIAIVNEAVDKVRRSEQKSRPELKNTRYIWLKNTTNLTGSQADTLDDLSQSNLKTARAYRIRLPGPLQPAVRRGCGSLPQEVVFLGHSQSAAPDHRGRKDRQAPLGRHPALVRDHDRQRLHGGHQQPRPSR